MAVTGLQVILSPFRARGAAQETPDFRFCEPQVQVQFYHMTLSWPQPQTELLFSFSLKWEREPWLRRTVGKT